MCMAAAAIVHGGERGTAAHKLRTVEVIELQVVIERQSGRPRDPSLRAIEDCAPPKIQHRCNAWMPAQPGTTCTRPRTENARKPSTCAHAHAMHMNMLTCLCACGDTRAHQGGLHVCWMRQAARWANGVGYFCRRANASRVFIKVSP